MKTTIPTPIFVTVLLFLVSACTHHYTPTPDRYPIEKITDFKPTATINIVNAQPSDADFLYAAGGGHEHYGKLNAWTDVAITIAKQELKKRGMSAAPNANKTLKMSVVHGNIEFGMWRSRGAITLNIETGDGYEKTYRTENATPGGIHYAIDGALMRAVVAMFNDDDVAAYLSK